MKRLAITAILMASVIGGHEAGATPVNITANRLVQLGSDDFTGNLLLGPNSPSNALGVFGDFVNANLGGTSADAGQDSVIGASSFSGVGFSNVSDFGLQTQALSLFEVFFELTGNHSYSLGGSLVSDTSGGAGYGYANVDLSGPGGFFFEAWDFAPGGVLLAQTGTLGPGSYHLTVLSYSQAGEIDDFENETFSFQEYEFTFDLQEQRVPEPGSLALLVIGLAIAAFRKRV